MVIDADGKVRRKATYQDLTAVPDHMVAEIIDGELVGSPRPAPPHALASTTLGGDLSVAFGRSGGGGPGGWWILNEPELHLGEDVVVPDIAGWRRERMSALPEEAFFRLAPDWVCEVISPRTASNDRVRKMRIYGREKVAHMWIVNPLMRTLEVYRLEDGRWVVVGAFADSDKPRVEPFDAVELHMVEWWVPEVGHRPDQG